MAGNLNILLELTKIHIPLRTAGLFEQISSWFFKLSKQTAYFRINYTLSALCMAKRVFTGFREKKVVALVSSWCMKQKCATSNVLSSTETTRIAALQRKLL